MQQNYNSAKRAFEQKLASEVKNVSKSFLENVRNKTKVREGISQLKKVDDNFTETDKVEVFNAFFTSVFTKEDTTPIPDIKNSCQYSNAKLCIHQYQLRVKFKKLKISKSCAGPYGFPPCLLSNLEQSLSYPVTQIVNKSLSKEELFQQIGSKLT